MDKGANLTGAAGAYAPPLFWSRSLEHTLNSSPQGLEVSKSLVLHHYFLVPMGALENATYLPTYISVIKKIFIINMQF